MESKASESERQVDYDELRSVVGPTGLVTDPELMTGQVRDWTGRWVGSTPAVVYPRSTAEVVAVVEWCRRNHVALVPQGGNTGMVGGGVPLGGELLVNLGRMTAVDVDAQAGHLVAEAGATLHAVQEAAHSAGWHYAVDLGARDSATIGGTIATNAGGLQVLRYGDTRHQLLGVEAVSGTGAVVGDLRGLLKDNTGYHIPSLLAGSEGTLAVITRACLRLHAPASQAVVALIGFDAEAEAIAAVPDIRRHVADLRALELFLADGLALVCEQLGLPSPLDRSCAAYLLLEAAGAEGVTERLAHDLAQLGVATDAVAVGEDPAQRARLWRYREAHTEAISMVGIPHKLDVTLPHVEMAGFITDVRHAVASHTPGARTWIFGHAADGNLHVNVTGVDPADEELDGLVLELVAERGGSISAEHGIGRAKAAHLHLNRTEAELTLARRLKDAFDPDGILNPGVLFPHRL